MNVDKHKIPVSHSKRIKLSPEKKLVIKKEYKQGNVSLRELGVKYSVDKRTIQFCVHPEKYTQSLKARRERWAQGKYRGHYDKEKHRKAMQDLRERKRQAFAKD